MTGTANTIISGDNSFRPLTMDINSNLTISKLTITSGTPTKEGGIYNNQGYLIISNSLITNNKATRNVEGGVVAMIVWYPNFLKLCKFYRIGHITTSEYI